MPNELKDQPLGRSEAQRIVRWLREEKGRVVIGGWVAVHKLTPAQIAKEYTVDVNQIIDKARLNVQIKQ